MNFTVLNKTGSSYYCYSPYNGKIYLTVESIYFLAFLDGIILLANLVLNILVIIVILKTKQISSTASKLIFNLSIADIVHGLIGQSLFLASLFIDFSCVIQYTALFFLYFFGYVTVYTIGLIGLDRYVRIQYKTSYASVLTSERVHLLIFTVYCLAMLRASMNVIGFALQKVLLIRILGSVIDFISMSIIACMQMASVRAIKKVMSESDNQAVMQGTSKAIIRLSSGITICFLAFSITATMLVFLSNIFETMATGNGRQAIKFMQFFGYLIAHSNSVASAVLFFTYNTKGKAFLRNLRHCCSRSNRTNAQ